MASSPKSPDTNSNGFAVKEQQVEEMFNGIAPKYDLLNHVLSLGIDKLWRKRVVRAIAKNRPSDVLDVATGTADLAIALARSSSDVNIVGVDIAEEMLQHGRLKVEKIGLANRITLTKASSLLLPFEDNTFDAAMVAFGVRNFENSLVGLSEMQRVIKPGGTINVLEFTTPRFAIISWIYRLYFSRVLPWVGRIVSGHKTAYTYLPVSVSHFKEREDFVALLRQSGFINAQYKQQSFGISAIYTAVKP